MKKSPSLIYYARPIILALLLPIFSVSLPGANLVVQVGEQIQDKVAAASAGDVVIIRGGTHVNQTNITIDKAIRLVREKGTSPSISASITLSGLTEDFVLRDLHFSNLTINNCANVGLEDLLSTGTLTTTNSKVTVRSCKFGTIRDNGGSNLQIIDHKRSFSGYFTNSDILAVNSLLSRIPSSVNSNITLTRCTQSSSYSSSPISLTGGKLLVHDSTLYGNISVDGTEWRAHGSTFGSFTSKNSQSNLLRCTVNRAFIHSGQDKDCVVFQSSIGRTSGDILISDANRTWVCYSILHHASIEGGSEAHIIGNEILNDKANTQQIALSYNSSQGVIYVKNNRFQGKDLNSDTIHTNQYEVQSENWTEVKSLTVNNTVQSVKNKLYQYNTNSDKITLCRIRFNYYDGSYAYSNENSHPSRSWSGEKTYLNPHPLRNVSTLSFELKQNYYTSPGSSYKAYLKDTFLTHEGQTVHIESAKEAHINNNLFYRWNKNFYCLSLPITNTKPEVHGNIFYRGDGQWPASPNYVIYGGNGGLATHNCFEKSLFASTGITYLDRLWNIDPKINTTSWKLNEGSPLIDAGPEEPHFKDHDGSRNDIGMFGGHAYDPEGRTSTNPVVLSGTQNIVRMNVGDTTPLIIKSRGAVSTSNQ